MVGLCFYPDIPRSSHKWRVVPRKPDWMVGIIFLPPPGIPCGLQKCIMYYLKLDEYISIVCHRKYPFSPILNYSDTAEFYQCLQTHLQCSPNCEFHTPNSPFVPPTVIRGKYIAVMWMYNVIILHGSYTKSIELWNDNLIIKFYFLIGTDICSSIGPFWKPLGVCQR